MSDSTRATSSSGEPDQEPRRAQDAADDPGRVHEGIRSLRERRIPHFPDSADSL